MWRTGKKAVEEKKFASCEQCGLHYSPVTGIDSRWGHLCPVHRGQAKEVDQKKDLVRAWAERNWEALYEQAKKEADERAVTASGINQDAIRAMQRQQAAMNLNIDACYNRGMYDPYGGMI